MTFNPALVNQDLIWLAEIEPARKLEGESWTAAAPSCYYIAHPEGKPSRVRQCLKSTGVIVTYAPDVADLATCQSTASSWYWDAANTRLYVHTSTAADPGVGSGLFLVCSYFWERIADHQVDLDSHPYRPLLDASGIADLSFEATLFSDGGVTQSFGDVTALNPGGYWDARLAAYVYEGKRILIKFAPPGTAYASYIKLFDGHTGQTTWTDAAVVFKTEDPRRFQE